MFKNSFFGKNLDEGSPKADWTFFALVTAIGTQLRIFLLTTHGLGLMFLFQKYLLKKQACVANALRQGYEESETRSEHMGHRGICTCRLQSLGFKRAFFIGGHGYQKSVGQKSPSQQR